MLFRSNERIFVVPVGGALNLNSLTLSNGMNTSGGGGAIHNSGTLTISNSTFGNSSTTGNGNSGGAINTFFALTITNSTFSGNSASDGAAIYRVAWGSSTITIRNSIFFSSNGSDCLVTELTDGGYNLSKDASCLFTGTGSQQT